VGDVDFKLDFTNKINTKYPGEYELLKIYKKNNRNYAIVKHICGEIRDKPFINLIRTYCPICSKKRQNKSQVLSHEEFLNNFNLIHKDYEVLSEYTGWVNKIKIKCLKCNKITEKRAGRWTTDKLGCICRRKKEKIKKEKIKIKINYKNIVKKMIQEILGSNYKLLNYNNSSDIDMLHLKCNKIKNTNSNSIKRGYGCNYCYNKKESNGVSKIKNILNELSDEFKIDYKIEVKFSNCVNIKKLPFDFGVYKKNKLLFLIEYDGEQHFKAKDFTGGIKKLNEIMRNDLIKTNYCKRNNIKLLRISYKTVKIKEIESKIFNLLYSCLKLRKGTVP
jgi:hypothetical protein